MWRRCFPNAKKKLLSKANLSASELISTMNILSGYQTFVKHIVFQRLYYQCIIHGYALLLRALSYYKLLIIFLAALGIPDCLKFLSMDSMLNVMLGCAIQMYGDYQVEEF